MVPTEKNVVTRRYKIRHRAHVAFPINNVHIEIVMSYKISGKFTKTSLVKFIFTYLYDGEILLVLPVWLRLQRHTLMIGAMTVKEHYNLTN